MAAELGRTGREGGREAGLGGDPAARPWPPPGVCVCKGASPGSSGLATAVEGSSACTQGPTHWPPRPDRSAHDTQGHCCVTTALTARLPRAQVSPSSAGGSAPGVASAPLPKASNRSIQLPASSGEAGPQAQPWRLPGASTAAGGVLTLSQASAPGGLRLQGDPPVQAAAARGPRGRPSHLPAAAGPATFSEDVTPTHTCPKHAATLVPVPCREPKPPGDARVGPDEGHLGDSVSMPSTWVQRGGYLFPAPANVAFSFLKSPLLQSQRNIYRAGLRGR